MTETPEEKARIDKMISQSIICPHCGATEVARWPEDATEEQRNNKFSMGVKWQIKAFKVDDHSHCLVCDRWFGLDD